MDDNETQTISCCVCFNALIDDSGECWSCRQCHNQCHLHCIFQWTLRQLLNNRERSNGFTCPVCRAHNTLQTLPGFENETASSQQTTVQSRPQTAILHLLSDIFPHTRRQQNPIEIGIETTTVADNTTQTEAQEEEDDDDDDETYQEGSERSVFRIKARTFNLTIQSFTITQP